MKRSAKSKRELEAFLRVEMKRDAEVQRALALIQKKRAKERHGADGWGKRADILSEEVKKWLKQPAGKSLISDPSTMIPDTFVRVKDAEGNTAIVPKSQLENHMKKQEAKKVKDLPKATKGQPVKGGTKSEAAPPAGKRSVVLAQKIKVVAKENPKREGTAAHKKFKLYKDGMTVEQFIAKGGTLSCARHDVAHGFIKLS
jgi:hypothetical protein